MGVEDNLRLLKALSEETRYCIIRVLLEGERCACELPILIDRTQSNTSMHLQKLVELKVLKFRREGKKMIYSIADQRVYCIFDALASKNIKAAVKKCCVCTR